VNLLIRTRIFENYSEVVKCHDCSALVHEGLLPMQRIHEGLNMKQWKCANRKCKHFNLEESTLRCKKCQTPRPFKTLPKDLVFPLYLPMNEKIRDNELAMVFSQVLYFVPNVKI